MLDTTSIYADILMSVIKKARVKYSHVYERERQSQIIKKKKRLSTHCLQSWLEITPKKKRQRIKP